VDFYCAEAKLIIEVDGDFHVTHEAYDATRTEWLEGQGYRVIRFTNNHILKNLDEVAMEILRSLEGGA
jgi:very-short-patch-repair endonuclease